MKLNKVLTMWLNGLLIVAVSSVAAEEIPWSLNPRSVNENNDLSKVEISSFYSLNLNELLSANQSLSSLTPWSFNTNCVITNEWQPTLKIHYEYIEDIRYWFVSFTNGSAPYRLQLCTNLTELVWYDYDNYTDDGTNTAVEPYVDWDFTIYFRARPICPNE